MRFSEVLAIGESKMRGEIGGGKILIKDGKGG
jgi:hypothetical protein